jgi:hypothetical protein
MAAPHGGEAGRLVDMVDDFDDSLSIPTVPLPSRSEAED